MVTVQTPPPTYSLCNWDYVLDKLEAVGNVVIDSGSLSLYFTPKTNSFQDFYRNMKELKTYLRSLNQKIVGESTLMSLFVDDYETFSLSKVNSETKNERNVYSLDVGLPSIEFVERSDKDKLASELLAAAGRRGYIDMGQLNWTGSMGKPAKNSGFPIFFEGYPNWELKGELPLMEGPKPKREPEQLELF